MVKKTGTDLFSVLIVLTPVCAAMVRAAVEWPWNSYRATTGYERALEAFDVDWILDRKPGQIYFLEVKGVMKIKVSEIKVSEHIFLLMMGV